MIHRYTSQASPILQNIPLKTPYRERQAKQHQQYIQTPSTFQRKNSLKLNGDKFVSGKTLKSLKCTSSTIESLDLPHQLVQNLEPIPSSLIPSGLITFLPPQSSVSEVDINANNVLETEISGNIESHACQLHNDILSQCLDTVGTYSCKEYSPRCYIIQKVIIRS